jgi:hypothetical protein
MVHVSISDVLGYHQKPVVLLEKEVQDKIGNNLPVTKLKNPSKVRSKRCLYVEVICWLAASTYLQV